MESEKDKIFSFTEKSIERLFSLYHLRLVAYATRIVGSEAIGGDIVQDIFLKLWENSPKIYSETIKSYLFVQCRNTCINYLRQEKIFNNKALSIDTASIESLYMVDFIDEVDDGVHEKILSDVLKFIETLPPQTRNVFYLSRIDGLSHKIISLQLAISEKAVEKHITIALKRFKSKFRLVR